MSFPVLPDSYGFGELNVCGCDDGSISSVLLQDLQRARLKLATIARKLWNQRSSLVPIHQINLRLGSTGAYSQRILGPLRTF